MSTVLDYYKYAALATASYVRMGGVPLTGEDFAREANAQEGGRLPLVLGEKLFVRSEANPDVWNILRYYGGDLPTIQDPVAAQDTTGFAATLFERGGEKVLAMRGTEPFAGVLLPDLRAGLGGIGIVGMALAQAVSMVNLIQRLKGNAGTPVLQIRVEASLSQPAGPHVVALGNAVLAPVVYLEFSTHTATGLGLIGEGEKITVTGHSLGGHLALLAGRLFPQLVNPDVYVYNAAGVDPVSASLTQPLSLLLGIPALAADLGLAALNILPVAQQLTDELIGKMGTFLAQPPAADFSQLRIHNLESEDLAPGDDLSLVSSVFTGAPVHGPEIFVPQEANSHVIEPLMDALALHALLYSLNNNLSMADMGRLLEAASPSLVKSDERLVEALRKLFFNEGSELPVSDALGLDKISKGEINARATFHDAVLRIGEAIKDKGYQLDLLLGVLPGDLSNLAQGSEAIAYRYALKELNPFAIVGDNSLYVIHNPNGELDLYNPATRTGSLTQAWIADRAEFLARKNQYFAADGQIVFRADRNENILFENRTSSGATDLSLTVVGNAAAGGNSGAGANPAEVLFGNAATDVLTGGILSDRLYGNAGTDWLEGKAGADYLEGGSGLDIYNYNAFSGLLSSGNDGADTILDTDGKGVLRYTFTQSGLFSNTVQSTVIAEASRRVSGIQWQSADGQFSFTRSQNDLIVSDNRPGGGSITLKDFRDGDFGIRLREPIASPTQVIAGDQNPDALDDFLSGAPDVNVGFQWKGLTGNDVVNPISFGSDLIEGNAGADILEGSNGSDEVFGGDAVNLATFITESRTATGTGLRGDWASGGLGDDLVVGSHGNDVLMGGGGADLLAGGGGDDVIDGDDNFLPSTNPVPINGGEIPERFYTAPKFDWSVDQTDPFNPSFSFINIFSTAREVGAGDVVYAGAGNDFVAGLQGDDVLFGDAGDDVMRGDDGSDILVGGGGNDRLAGESAGNLHGDGLPVQAPGGDYLDGGAGNDELLGEEGDDILIGGAGDDILRGGPGKDIYVFNKGDGKDTVVDTLFGIDHPEAGVLVLGEGFSKGDIKFRLGSLLVDLGPVDPSDPSSARDQIHFEGFDPFDPFTTPVLGEIRFTDGASMIFEDILAQGFDIEGTEEDDDGNDAAHPMLIGTAVSDRINGLGGNDILLAAAGDDVLDGGAGDDHLQGGEGNDVLIGGEGVDVLQGEAGVDTYIADFDDIINDNSGGDLVDLGVASANEVIVSRAFTEGGKAVVISLRADADPTRAPRGLTIVGDISTQNVRFAFGGEEFSSEAFFNLAFTDPLQLFGTAGDDVLRGFGGADQLLGLEGSDQLFGGSGDDTLEGDVGDDRLEGGAGVDMLIGGQGADVYLIGSGTGRDTIVDGGDSLSTDALDFSAEITAEAVTFARQANGDLTVTVDEVDEITITGHYNNSASRIEEFRFADGRIVTAGELESLTVSPITGSAGDDELIGGPFDEVLMGLAGSDTLDGKGGNDVLQGGDGEDTYILDYGMDQDTAMDSGVNVIALRSELTATDLSANRRGSDLLVSIRGSEEGFMLADYFVTPQSWRTRDLVGVEVLVEDAIAATEARAQQGAATLRDDYIAGLNAQASRELVAQGYVAAGQGAFSRTLATPFSADYIAGAQYRTIVFRSVTGEIASVSTQTFPMDAWNYSASGSLVRSAAQLQNQTIFSDAALIFAPTATRFQTSSSDFDWVGLDWTVSSHGSVTHNFRTNIQAWLSPPFDPVTGDPTFRGTIETYDEFLFQQNFARGEITPVPDGVPLQFPSFRQLFPRIAFAQITDENITQAFYEVIGGAGDNTIRGGDIVQADAGNDTVDSSGFIDGGPGNDTLLNGRLMLGGAGDDQLIGGFGANRFWLSAEGNGADAIRDVEGTDVTDFALLYYRSIGVPQEILFLIAGGEEGGQSLDDIIEQLGLPELPQPDDFAATEPVLAANDFAVDIVEFEAGVGLADLSFAWNVERAALEISWAGGAAQIAFPVSNSRYGYGVERFSFADGTALGMSELLAFAPPKPVLPILGTADSDFIEGSRFADLIRGLDGDDSINAGWGDDVLDGGAGFDFLDGGDGDDLLEGGADNDFLGGAEGVDVLDGGAGNDELGGGEGNDIYLLSPGAGSDFVYEFDSTPGNVDTVRFGPGIAPQSVTAKYDGFYSFVLGYGESGDTLFLDQAAINPTSVIERFEFADGTVWDWVTVQRLAGVIVGTEAADVLAGGAGADMIRGLGGDDAISAGDGDDRVFGGAGNDTLAGGPGNDVLRGEEGNDAYVFNFGDGVDTIIEADGFDTLSFGPGITSEMVTPGVGSFLIRVGESGDVIHIEGFDPRDALGSPVIELFQFADGTSITYGELLARGFDIIGTEGEDFLSGTNLQDRIDGLAGDDNLQGGRANDILRGGDGADLLLDGEGNNFLDGGAGDDTIFAYGMPIYAEGGNNLVIGGAGDDWIYSYATKNVIAFNTGDGQDTVYAVTALTLSLGGGIEPSALSLSQDGADLVLAIGANDSIRLTREFEAKPQTWPPITLQLFGSVHLYDFNAVISDFRAATTANPSLVDFTLDGVLQSHETSVSETDAYSGALAYQYATTGSLNALNDAAISQVLADAGFGTAPQIIAVPGGNQAPVLGASLADQSAAEDAAFGFAIPAGTFTDSDAGDALAYSAALFDGSLLPGWLSFDGATQSFSGTPINADVGAISVKVTVTDGSDASVSDIFVLTVTNTNDVPVLVSAIADQTAIEDAAFSFTVPANSFADVDAGDVLTYSASLANDDPLPLWLTFDAIAHTFTGMPANEDVGAFDVTVTATDMAGAAASVEFALEVVNVNDAPATVNDSASVVEDGMQIASGNVLANDTDVDSGSVLSLANPGVYVGIGTGADYGTLTLEADGTFTFALNNATVQTLAEGEVAQQAFIYIATDGVEMVPGGPLTTTPGILSISVLGVNDAPVVDQPIVDQSADAGIAFSFTMPENTFFDIDQGDILTYSATLTGGGPLPGWLSFDAATRSFFGTPGASDAGTFAIRTTATDLAEAAAFDDFQLMVAAGSEGVHLIGTPRDDVMTGTDFDDTLLGKRGEDRLYGRGGDDLLVGGRGRDQLFGDNGADVLYGKGGKDTLYGGAGDDLLAGGRGNDNLEGGLGNDVYVHERNGGNDVIEETGGQDALRFGAGIAAGTARLYRKKDDLLVALAGEDGSVTVKGWFASDSKKVESIQFADGTAWDADYIRSHLSHGKPPRPRQDDDDHDHHHDRDDHQGKSDRKHDDDRDDRKSRHERDSMAELLEAYLAHEPRYEFEALAREFDRSSHHGEALSAREIARRWQAVERYGKGLSDERDEDARHGAATGWQLGRDLLGAGALGGGIGHAGSTGSARGTASLPTLQGLEEGLRRL